MPVHLSATTLIPGRPLAVWSAAGDLDPTAWTIRQATGTDARPVPWAPLASRSVQWWDRHYHHGLLVPDLKAGDYILSNGRDSAKVTIAARPFAPWTFLTPETWWSSPIDRASDLEAALRRGSVELRPGRYELARPVAVPPGRTIRGPGAVLHRRWSPGDNDDAVVFRGAGGPLIDFELQDVTVTGDDPPASRSEAATRRLLAPEAHQCCLRDVTIRCGALGAAMAKDLVVMDCLFDQAAVLLIGDGALFLRTTFRGLTRPGFGPAWMLRGGDGVAVLDCTWEDTDRGPVIQTLAGEVDTPLLAGVVVRGCRHTFNGCEGWLTEGPHAVYQPIVLHLHYEGEGNGIQLGTAPTIGGVFRDFVLSGGNGLWLMPTGRELAHRGNVFEAGEIRGGGVHVGRGVEMTRFATWTDETGQAVASVRVIDRQPTRGNQFHRPARSSAEAVVDEGAGTDLAGLSASAERPVQ